MFFPHCHHSAFVALYINVLNSKAIKARIIDAAKGTDQDRDAVNYAFIDASLITSQLHLQTAIHQALLAQSLRTKTVHSEILWMLNPTNNITEAIRRYGVSESTTSLIVVRIGDFTDNLDDIVQGTRVPFDLDGITDWQKVKKYHKLGDMDNNQVDKIVTSSVAMKTVM